MPKFQIQFTDPTFIAAPAREAAFKWAGNEILISQQDNPQLLAVDATGRVTFDANSDAPWDVSGAQRRLAGAIQGWRLVGRPPGVPQVVASATFEAVVSARARLSLWTDLARFSNRVVAVRKTKSAQIPSATEYAAFIERFCGGMDDLSLVATFAPSANGEIDYAKNFGLFGLMATAKDGRKPVETALTNLVEACHSVGVQVSAGYEVRDDYSAQTQGSFVDYICSQNSDMDAHATRIRDKVRAMNFDGVGFDIEVNGIGPTKEGADIEKWVRERPTSSARGAREENNAARNIETLYHRLAEKLLPENCFVTYATAAFVNPANHKFEDGLYRFGHTRVQPIGLVRDHPNLIARIMAYDEGYQADPPNDSLAGRHKEILDGVTAGGIHPSGIQLGVKMSSLKDFGMKSGHMTVAQTRERCKLLRKYRVGLVTFSASAQGSSDDDEVAGFAGYDAALNEDESQRDAYAGVPFQAPHFSIRRRPSP